MFVQLKQAFQGKPPGERIDVSNEHADILIKGGIAEAIQGDPLGEIVEKQVGGMLESLTRGLNDTITATLKQFAAAQTKSNKNAVPAIFGEGGEGDPRKNFGDFCLAVATKNHKRLDEVYKAQFADDKGNVIQKAAMAESSGVTGGYIVPPEFYRQLLYIAAEQAFIRPRAFVQPMASATLQFPYLDITTVQTAGVSPFFGGVQMTWTEEAQTRTETEPQFKMMELKAHELSGYSVSQQRPAAGCRFRPGEVPHDPLRQGHRLVRGVRLPAGQRRRQADGHAQRRGPHQRHPQRQRPGPVRGHGHHVVQAAAHQLEQGHLGVHAQRRSATAAAEGRRQPGHLHQHRPGRHQETDLVAARPAGDPDRKAAGPGHQRRRDADRSAYYVIGDRMQIEIAASEHVNFLKNQMTWRVVERVDGQPWLDKPITLQDGSTEVSPFVALD